MMKLLVSLLCLTFVAVPACAQEAEVLALINAERELNGCPRLAVNDKLSEAAQRQSDAMADDDFFAHVGPDGVKPSQRVTDTGYRWTMTAENIAAGYATPEEAVAGWMTSPGHRGNILNCAFTETGIAMTFQEDDKPLPGVRYAYRYYWVEVFGKPMR